MTHAGSAPAAGDDGALGKRERTGIVLSAVLVALAAVFSVTVFFGNRYMVRHWGGGNFPPLIGHLFVILLGGIMLAGLAASAVGSLLAAWVFVKSLRRRQGRTTLVALVTLMAGVTLFVYLNPEAGRTALPGRCP